MAPLKNDGPISNLGLKCCRHNFDSCENVLSETGINNKTKTTTNVVERSSSESLCARKQEGATSSPPLTPSLALSSAVAWNPLNLSGALIA